MRNDHIRKEARRIIRMCKTRDPFKIAKELGIIVVFRDDFDDLKGVYKIIKRIRFIFINADLSEDEQKTVCAHELGHDRLHRDLAESGAFQDHSLYYDICCKPEYEANIFASELLIDDDEILDLINSDYDLHLIAGELSVDFRLVLIKVDELRLRGYNVRVPYRPQSDFLGGN